MAMHDEVNEGIKQLRQRVEQGGNLRLRRSDPLESRMANYFEIRNGDKAVDFVLSHEFLSDLPATKEYQEFLEKYVSAIEKRFEQPNPLDFYCKSGSAINVEVRWPITPMANRDASFVHVTVRDLRLPQLIARCVVIFVYPVTPTGLTNPFDRQKMIVNRLRQAIDRQEVSFYARAAHPESAQQVELWAGDEATSPPSESDLVQFLSGKVYWLGFKRQDKNARVWIADPWDAEYLGVDPRALKQAAEIQEARDVIRLSDGEIAQASKGLLISHFEEQQPRTKRVFLSGTGKTAQMIRHVLQGLLPDASVVARDQQLPEGDLGADVRALIDKSDFLVFDLTEGSPNVFFELGYAQALKKPLAVLIARDVAADSPSDLAGMLYLPYDRGNPADLTSRLSSFIERYWGLPVGR